MVEKAESEDFLLFYLETDEYDERMGMPATANPFEWRQTLILFRYTDIMRVGDDNGNQ